METTDSTTTKPARRILSTSVPVPVAERLERLAHESDRTVSAELRRALAEHLRAEDPRGARR